jgi:hypothetical protein
VAVVAEPGVTADTITADIVVADTVAADTVAAVAAGVSNKSPSARGVAYYR